MPSYTISAPAIDALIADIGRLPEDWHKAGSVSTRVLSAIARLAADRRIEHSMETGSGKTTLLLSHLSADHTVFAIERYGDEDTGSITNVRKSRLFNAATVTFVVGPTQTTLPRHEFRNRLHFAMIDGPHGYPFPELEYYHIYPHLDEDALLIVDDIHIPTIHNLFAFLREDEMFELLEVVDNTAFFRRTATPTFSPVLDGWWLQAYNKKSFPMSVRTARRLDWLRPFVPASVKAFLRRRIGGM